MESFAADVTTIAKLSILYVNSRCYASLYYEEFIKLHQIWLAYITRNLFLGHTSSLPQSLECYYMIHLWWKNLFGRLEGLFFDALN